MRPRYPTNPHRVTLDLDPITSAALNEAAKAQRSDRQRLAYEFVQRGLGIGMTTPDQATPIEHESRSDELARQFSSRPTPTVR